MKSLIALALTTALITTYAANSFATEREDETLVTATRLPTPLRDVLPATQIITAQDIERLQPRDLPSLLGRLSGVDFRDSGGRGSVGGVFVRGAATSGVIVLIDGMRSASASIGATALEGIPVEAIERIEVVKGPLSGLYGADAVGGVIQIFTKRGREQRLTPQVHASYRSNDTHEYTGELSAGNGRGGFHATFSFENAAGIDRTTLQTGGNADRDGFDELAFNISANYRVHDRLEAQVALLRTDAHSDFDNIFGVDTGFDSDSKIENNNLKLIYMASEKLRLSFDAGHFVDDSQTPAFFSDLTSRRTSFSLQSDYAVHEHHTVTVGVDYYDERLDTLDNFTATSRENIGGFAQWQGRHGDFSAVANVRHDDNEAYGNNTNGSVALEYAIADNLAAVVSYGTAFRAPSFNDLFFPGFGNPDIKPEDSESVEVSLKGRHFGATWRINAYHTEVTDLIGFDSATFTAANTANATLQGVELELAYNLGAWHIVANSDYLDARDDATNIYLDDRAKFSANLDIYRQLGAFDIALDMQAESGRHDLRGTSIPGFSVVGAGVSYRLSPKIRAALRVENIFDDDYTQNLISATESFRTYGRTALASLHAAY